jgi:16S rRNA (guanine527-N7)-methyltransferase
MTEYGDAARSGLATPPAVADDIFGAGLAGAIRYVDLLRKHGSERGLIGPREVDRLWERHVLNSAVVAELIPDGARVVDVGSGAGLPGVPIALARPDLSVILVEPMERRVRWLEEVRQELGLQFEVIRGRAEEKDVRRRLGACDVATARAVAPLARLADWCLPLVREGGRVLAIKGASAQDEIERDRSAIAAAGGGTPEVRMCGQEALESPTTVVVLKRARRTQSTHSARRSVGSAGSRDYTRRTRKDR